MGPIFKVVFAKKKVLASPVNSARDPSFFSKTQERIENVRSKCTLRMMGPRRLVHLDVAPSHQVFG